MFLLWKTIWTKYYSDTNLVERQVGIFGEVKMCAGRKFFNPLALKAN